MYFIPKTHASHTHILSVHEMWNGTGTEPLILYLCVHMCQMATISDNTGREDPNIPQLFITCTSGSGSKGKT